MSRKSIEYYFSLVHRKSQKIINEKIEEYNPEDKQIICDFIDICVLNMGLPWQAVLKHHHSGPGRYYSREEIEEYMAKDYLSIEMDLDEKIKVWKIESTKKR